LGTLAIAIDFVLSARVLRLHVDRARALELLGQGNSADAKDFVLESGIVGAVVRHVVCDCIDHDFWCQRIDDAWGLEERWLDLQNCRAGDKAMNPPVKVRRSRFWVRVAIAALVVLLLHFWFELEITKELLTGWGVYLHHTLPNVRIRWDGIMLFAVGYVVCVACAHSLLGWLWKSAPTMGLDSSQAKPKPWRLGSSVAIVTLFLSIFAIGICLAGITHQVGWLVNAPEPMYTHKQQLASDNERSTYRIGQVDEKDTRQSWFLGVLPYAAWMTAEFDRSVAWNSERNVDAFKKVCPPLLNPMGGLPIKSPDGYGLSHFADNPNVFHTESFVRSEDIYTSDTLILGEVNEGLVPWAQPDNSRNLSNGLRNNWHGKSGKELGYGSPEFRSTQTTFGLLDGSVRNLSNSIEPKVLEQLGRLKPRE
jgi:hypothetical protein